MKNKQFAQDSYQYLDGVAKEPASRQGKLLRLLQSDFAMDLLSGVLLSSGLGAAVLTLTDIEYGFLSSLGLACIASSMIAVFSLKWWLAPAVIAASSAAAGLYLKLTESLEAVASFWSGFAGWALAGAHSDTDYNEKVGAEILQCIIIFAVSLFCFILIRKLFSLPMILLGTGAGFVSIYFFGRVDLSVQLCAACAGIIILMPRVYSLYVSRHGKSTNRGAMQIVAVPAAFFAMLLSLWIVPEDVSSWKSRGLGNFIADIAYFFDGPFRSYPLRASNFSMKRLGLEQENGLLGGPAQLTDERYLSVTAERPMLLRGAVKDFYTGTGWQVGAVDGDFRLESLFWQSYRRSAFGLGKPSGGEAKKLFESLTVEQDFTISYHSNRFSTIFAGGIPRDVQFEKNTILEPIYFNMRSELYLHYLLPNFTKLHIRSRVWNTGMDGFDESFLRLEQLAANSGDKNLPQIRQRYTQLPDTLPESVAELARSITAESVSPYQRVKAIERWLRENCEYSLEPVVPPEDIDFVGHFLDTRKGYCTYYASAMAVLARSVGLPARYVTGFGLEREAGDDLLLLATGETAHAWAEIYFDGIGWVEFDPLSWNPSEPLNSEQAALPDSQAQLESLPQAHVESGAAAENTMQNAPVQNSISARRILSFLAAAAVAYIMLYLAVRRMMSRKLRAYELTRVSRKIPDLRKRVDFYFDDILKQLSLLGIDPNAGETLTDFSGRVDRRVRLDSTSFIKIAKMRERQHFANAEATDVDCEDAFRYHRAIELLLRERLNKTAYFIKRVIGR